MTSHTKTYTNRYLFEQLNIVHLLFVMHSRSIGMQCELLGLSVQNLKNIQLFEQLLLSIWKKKLSVRMADYSAFWTAEVFTYGKGNQLSFHDALDLSQSTSLCWRIFQRYCSPDVKISVVFFTFTAATKIDKQDTKTKLFAQLSSCF